MFTFITLVISLAGFAAYIIASEVQETKWQKDLKTRRASMVRK